MLFKRLFLPILAISIASCSMHNESISLDDRPISESYYEAKNSFNRKDYNLAIKLYRNIVASYSDDALLKQSKLDLIEAEYLNKKYLDTIDDIDSFIFYYSDYKNIDKLLYIKGISLIHINNGLIMFITKDKAYKRDAKEMDLALESFNTLITKYPNSLYKINAINKIAKLKREKSNNELYIIAQYMRINAYAAAINRSIDYINKHESDTEFNKSVAKVYEVLGYAYKKLNNTDLSNLYYKKIYHRTIWWERL